MNRWLNKWFRVCVDEFCVTQNIKYWIKPWHGFIRRLPGHHYGIYTLPGQGKKVFKWTWIPNWRHHTHLGLNSVSKRSLLIWESRLSEKDHLPLSVEIHGLIRQDLHLLIRPHDLYTEATPSYYVRWRGDLPAMSCYVARQSKLHALLTTKIIVRMQILQQIEVN